MSKVILSIAEPNLNLNVFKSKSTLITIEYDSRLEKGMIHFMNQIYIVSNKNMSKI
jgi:hypothetical protein